jgi:hypothetical protein
MALRTIAAVSYYEVHTTLAMAAGGSFSPGKYPPLFKRQSILCNPREDNRLDRYCLFMRLPYSHVAQRCQ